MPRPSFHGNEAHGRGFPGEAGVAHGSSWPGGGACAGTARRIAPRTRRQRRRPPARDRRGARRHGDLRSGASPRRLESRVPRHVPVSGRAPARRCQARRPGALQRRARCLRSRRPRSHPRRAARGAGAAHRGLAHGPRAFWSRARDALRQAAQRRPLLNLLGCHRAGQVRGRARGREADPRAARAPAHRRARAPEHGARPGQGRGRGCQHLEDPLPRGGQPRSAPAA